VQRERLLVAMQVTRQRVVDVLRAQGLLDVAEEVNRSLPDRVDFARATAVLQRYGITKDVLISRMGGSP
jgi:hypothetical protein